MYPNMVQQYFFSQTTLPRWSDIAVFTLDSGKAGKALRMDLLLDMVFC